MRRLTMFLLLVGLLVFSCHADIVVFKNGDRLTGQVVRLEEGKLVFNASQVGELTIDLSRVAQFTSDEPAEFHLTDGTVIESKALSGEPGQIVLAETTVLPSQTLAFDQITAINPTVKPAVVWSGSITAGLTSTHGNSFNESANMAFSAKRRSETDRFAVWSAYLASRSENDDTGQKETTEEAFTFGGKYDYFWTEKFYTFLNGTFKKDHIADLDHRIIGGGGAGYQWFETPEFSFFTDAGLSDLCEQYTRRNPDTGLKETTDTEELSVQAGYGLDWRINDRFHFMHNMRYYPSLAGLSDYFLTTDAEIRTSLTKSMFTSFKAILDYDSTPGEGTDTTDTKYILGLGWSF